MANRHRGEIEAVLDGAPRRLVLTLGALAELETALGASDLGALAQRFEAGRLAAREVAAILGAGLRGAGAAITDEEVLRLAHPAGVPGLVALAAELLVATFLPDAERAPRADPPPAGPGGVPAPASSPGTPG